MKLLFKNKKKEFDLLPGFPDGDPMAEFKKRREAWLYGGIRNNGSKNLVQVLDYLQKRIYELEKK